MLTPLSEVTTHPAKVQLQRASIELVSCLVKLHKFPDCELDGRIRANDLWQEFSSQYGTSYVQPIISRLIKSINDLRKIHTLGIHKVARNPCIPAEKAPTPAPERRLLRYAR